MGWRWLQGLDVEILIEEVEVAVEFLLWIGSAVLVVPTLRMDNWVALKEGVPHLALAKEEAMKGLNRDLLEKIAKCIDTRTDVLHFHAICTTWRSSIPLPPKTSLPPLIKLPFPIGPNPRLNPKHRGHFTLKESTIFSIEPITKISTSYYYTTKTWLIKIEFLTASNEPNTKVLLKEPLSSFAFEGLNQKLPKVLNLLDYKDSEVSKVCGLEFIAVGKNLDEIEIRKVVVSDSKKDQDFAVMAVHTGAKLGVWKMGDKKWTNIDDGRERALYDDAVYYKGKFYAVDITGLAISVDSSMKIKKVVHPLPRFGFGHGGQFKYLVKSPDELFLVDKYYDVEREMFEDERLDFDSESSDFPLYLMVYKLNEEECEWVKVESLGDLALFVGDDCSFCVSVNDYVGCKANCVYFTEDSFSKGGRDDYPGYDTGLFDLEDGTASPLSAFPGYSKLWTDDED
ncbi:f-box protein skip23 [Quercus suber]|uniref:F-box protein skip23 n=1 Tax=Quercus suber TaxID=58331 RepID=A0AAW0KF10_QUESU